MLALIDELQESEEYDYIDYIPHNPTSPDYLELEEYFIKTYLPEFAEKISRIMLKLIWNYPCHIFLTEILVKRAELDGIAPFTDIRHYSPERLACIIKEVILNPVGYMNIFFSEAQFLITIGGEFSVTLYYLPDEVRPLLQLLCCQEGLFLKHKACNGERTIIV